MTSINRGRRRVSESGIQWIESIVREVVDGVVDGVVVTVRVVLGFRGVLGTVNLNNKGDGRLSDIETNEMNVF
eukprot:CAMPEP_0182503254 /NCGR_PEP_ID=MMETSP1321-20130603/14978_1 /TAXON_ID=91990 /ORGANISM="Bolidomonas sp., Strain RCC1657" /LENGTH=72 /DNA_ID=CAMNT_0024708387 /DNA_START=141 /DNA_END=359 /DNA_ORIENTATION=-